MHLANSLLWILAFVFLSKGDDSPGPGFFLKITKNVPRLGRRSESFFSKNSKTIPRMGRSGSEEVLSTNERNPIYKWLNDDLSSSSSSHPLSKRLMMSGPEAAAAAEREYSVVQPVNSNTLIELLNKDAIPSENVKFVHWKDFDRALQLDTDLYAKVISLGRRPDQRLKEDLGFSTYVPSSFFRDSNRNGMGGGGGGAGRFYGGSGNELYAEKFDHLSEYNGLM